MSIADSSTNVSVADPLAFVATDVTGLRRLEFNSIDGHRPAGEVAMSIASAMDLPTNVPWSLRDQKRARMLEQETPLGSQIDTESELVVIPRSHLG
jgi:hypothetical protein